MVRLAAVLGFISMMLTAPRAFSEQEKLAQKEPRPQELQQDEFKETELRQAQDTALEVYFSHSDLVLAKGQEVTRFFTPKALAEHGRFQVRIPGPKAKNENPSRERTLADRIEARRIMHAANQAFFEGEIAETWDLVAKAERLDPSFYRIKTMKGSLLFKIGSTDLALEVWQESLAQNPNQPEILQVIKTVEAGQSPRPNMAKAASAVDKKASLQ